MVRIGGRSPNSVYPLKVDPALIGKAGEMLVATELMRRGIDVAYPAADFGVDLVAFRRKHSGAMANKFVPIQVKSRSLSGYHFQRSWFSKATNLVLVHVWHISSQPEFYVFSEIEHVEQALGDHALSASWDKNGGYSITEPTERHQTLMQVHENRWDRIIEQLPEST